jgi:hypothetical protein
MRALSLTVILITSLLCSGCIPLLVGGAIGAGVVAATKNNQRKSKLTDMQRRAMEEKEIEGTKEDVIRATITIFQDKGLIVRTSDYQSGIITAGTDKPFFQITASVEQFAPDRVKMRIIMKDEKGATDDPKPYVKMFSDIETEMFRRANLNK